MQQKREIGLARLQQNMSARTQKKSLQVTGVVSIRESSRLQHIFKAQDEKGMERGEVLCGVCTQSSRGPPVCPATGRKRKDPRAEDRKMPMSKNVRIIHAILASPFTGIHVVWYLYSTHVPIVLLTYQCTILPISIPGRLVVCDVTLHSYVGMHVPGRSMEIYAQRQCWIAYRKLWCLLKKTVT